MIAEETIVKDENKLFPVFLKLENMSLLVVGGGTVALEKLNAVLANSPATKIILVGTVVSNDIRLLAADFPNITINERPFELNDLNDVQVVISAVDDNQESEAIALQARAKGKLINVADKPDLCDFYLGSIVKKGNLKIAISTNGKSPTIAKRLKEAINELIPHEVDDVLNNMHFIRNGINGNFDEKVRQLNDLTKVLVAKQATFKLPKEPAARRWQTIVKYCLFAFVFMILGQLLYWLIPFSTIVEGVRSVPELIDTRSFLLMLLTGFIAQMADGSMGMGYGTISTTFLLAQGVNPAIVSSRVHTARVFSSGVSGFSHHRFGNINKKLFKALVIPGVIGAIIGASLSYYGQKYASYVRLPLALYTLYLGYFIVIKGLRKNKSQAKVKRAGWLASVGGFMDAFAGGGWGTLVTSTLMAKRRSPRYVIGSVCLAEFFVVLASAITFFILLRHIPLADVAGLIIGGLIAAPIAARLVGKLPLKAMFIAVGSLVALTSINTLVKVIIKLME